MDVLLAVGRGDQKEQLCRFAVQRLIVDTRRDNHRRKSGARDGRGLGMRDGNPFADAGCAFGFPVEDCLLVSRFVDQIAVCRHQVDEKIDGGLFVFRRCRQTNTVFAQQVYDSHFKLLYR